MVALENGEIASMNGWRRHYTSMEGGHVVSRTATRITSTTTASQSYHWRTWERGARLQARESKGVRHGATRATTSSPSSSSRPSRWTNAYNVKEVDWYQPTKGRPRKEEGQEMALRMCFGAWYFHTGSGGLSDAWRTQLPSHRCSGMVNVEYRRTCARCLSHTHLSFVQTMLLYWAWILLHKTSWTNYSTPASSWYRNVYWALVYIRTSKMGRRRP